MTSSFARNPIPVDAKRQDWARIIAQDLNEIERGYAWAFDLLWAVVSSEVVHMHTVMQPFSIAADWGAKTINGVTEYTNVIASIDTTPSLALDIRLKPFGNHFYNSIGAWLIGGTDIIATTADGKQVDVAKGDTIQVVAPATVSGDLTQGCFTFVGSRAR